MNTYFGNRYVHAMLLLIRAWGGGIDNVPTYFKTNTNQSNQTNRNGVGLKKNNVLGIIYID